MASKTIGPSENLLASAKKDQLNFSVLSKAFENKANVYVMLLQEKQCLWFLTVP